MKDYLEYGLYALVVIIALHIVAGIVFYFIALDMEEKKKKQEEANQLAMKRQAEDDRIEVVRKGREAAYYAKLRTEQRGNVPTTVMPLLDPRDIFKKK